MKRHVLVTGGSRGLGLVITNHLLEADYAVTCLARSQSVQLQELAQKYPEALTYLAGDLAQLDDLLPKIDQAAKQKPYYALVNNAAIAGDGLLVSTARAAIEQVITVNLTAPLLLCRLVAKQMIIAREGRIVNISSIAAVRAYRGLATYTATKAGIEGFTRTLARELGPRNITVNAIAPGFMETDMTNSIAPEAQVRILQRSAVGGMVAPEDVAKLTLFLLSPSARMITGAILPIDGGASL